MRVRWAIDKPAKSHSSSGQMQWPGAALTVSLGCSSRQKQQQQHEGERSQRICHCQSVSVADGRGHADASLVHPPAFGRQGVGCSSSCAVGIGSPSGGEICAAI